MADHLSEDVANKVLRQVEFYFSDSNLPRDNFLRKCVEENEEGLVSLPLVCSFSRMRNHLGLKETGPDKVPSETTAAVAEILRKSSCLRVSDDGQRVGRVSKLLKPDEIQEQVNSRTIAAGPLPYDVKLEDVEGFFGQHGKVNSVRLPRHSFVNKAFCGVALIEFSSDEEAANIIQSNLVFDGANLDLKSKKDFDAERQALEQNNDDQRLHWLRHEKFGASRSQWQDGRAVAASENDSYPKGLIIAFNLKETPQEEAGEKMKSAKATNTENSVETRNGDHSIEAVADVRKSGEPKDKEGNEQMTREDIKNVMQKYGTVKAISMVRCRDSDGILMHDLRRQLDLPENWEERVIVDTCGLYRAMETVRPPMDMSLLLELCRLWSPQRGGFVFSWGGIYRVTVQDIRQILGVASRGDICVLTSRSFGEEREAARVLYGGAEPGPHGVPLASIVGGRARLAVQAILTTLVQRVTGSTNYSSVPTGWRRTLEACLGGRRMDWATVIRESLAAKLGRVTQKSGPGAGILELPYCSILISWLHEYFPATGPAQEAVVGDETPRMQRWSGVPRGEQARMVARPVWGKRVTALTAADYVAVPFGDCDWASDAEEAGRPTRGVAEQAVPIADIPPEVPVAGDEAGSAAGGGAPEAAAEDPEAMEDPVGCPTESVEILPEGDLPGHEGRRVAAWLKVIFPDIGRHPMLREVELEGLGGPLERVIQARYVIAQYDAQWSTMIEWSARIKALKAQIAAQDGVIETLRETISGQQASLKAQQDFALAQQGTIATLVGQPRRRVRRRVDGGAGTSQEGTSGGGTEPAPSS